MVGRGEGRSEPGVQKKQKTNRKKTRLGKAARVMGEDQGGRGERGGELFQQHGG